MIKSKLVGKTRLNDVAIQFTDSKGKFKEDYLPEVEIRTTDTRTYQYHRESGYSRYAEKVVNKPVHYGEWTKNGDFVD